MTEEGVRLRRTEGLVVDSPQADAGGLVVSPISLCIFPQEWGIKGVETSPRTLSAGFAFATTALQLGSTATTKRGPPRTILDSRFRGNDRGGCPPEADRESEGFSPSPIEGEGFALCGVCRGAKPLCRESEGVPQIPFLNPPMNGG